MGENSAILKAWMDKWSLNVASSQHQIIIDFKFTHDKYNYHA